MTVDESNDRWVRVCTTRDLKRQRNRVLAGPHGEVVVFWNDGEPCAMANICIHRKRELARGNIFGGRVVCPGHQWAFDTATGFCAERDRTQPVFAVRVDGDEVLVDPTQPVNAERLARTEPVTANGDAETGLDRR